MRVTLAVLVIFGVLAGVHSQDDEDAPVGTEDNPYGEGEHDEDDQGGEEIPEDGEEGDEEPEPTLDHYEDKGETVTAAHLKVIHKKMDANKDGKVSTQEVMDYSAVARKSNLQKEIAGAFDEMPSTADGHMTLDEHMSEVAEFHEGTDEQKEHQKKADIAKFKAADINNDGKLDKEELVHLMHPDTHPEVLEIHAVEEMRKRDTNKDGKLSKEEWNVDATPGEHQAHNPDHEHDPEADFASLDEDKSGFISLDELRHWESGLFHSNDAINKLILLADKDHDGVMSEKELAGIVDNLDGHEAHPHLMDWVFHEEL